MSDTTAGILQVCLLIAALGLCYRPLGAYMARVYTSDHHTRVERGIYRVMGVDPQGDRPGPCMPVHRWVSLQGAVVEWRLAPCRTGCPAGAEAGLGSVLGPVGPAQAKTSAASAAIGSDGLVGLGPDPLDDLGTREVPYHGPHGCHDGYLADELVSR
jgi:hypothetical protein